MSNCKLEIPAPDITSDLLFPGFSNMYFVTVIATSRVNLGVSFGIIFLYQIKDLNPFNLNLFLIAMPAVRYMPRKISDIEKNDTRIAVMGKIIESKESSFILDDGSGKIEIYVQLEGTEEMANNINAKVGIGGFVRVFCTIIGTQLKADVVQSLQGLDVEQLKKIEGLYNKAGI